MCRTRVIPYPTLLDSVEWIVCVPYSCNARIHAVGGIDYLSNVTDASLCIHVLQYEHMSRGRGYSATVIFNFLKRCTLPMLNKKELETLWSLSRTHTSIF